MKVILKKGLRTSLPTLVVFAAKDSKSGKPITEKISAELEQLFKMAHSDANFSGEKRETVFYRRANVDGYTHVLLVGLGDSKNLTSEAVRIAGSVVYGALKAHKITGAALHGDSLMSLREEADSIQALTEGLELAAYEFTDLKSKRAKEKPKGKGKGKKDKRAAEAPTLQQVTMAFGGSPKKEWSEALRKAEILTDCTNFVRWLGDNPGNFMTPSRLAQEAVQAAKGVAGLKVTVWNKARIKKERFGGLLSVASGSAEEPRFIIMEYKGGGKSPPVCFVGKGLTFDTGGISIKPSAAMEEMKYDMCGGAAVIGTLVALARLKAKVNAVGLVVASENMPGPAALKPGDVFFARNGKSVEVFNTDAEGRLILADALSYASELKPKAIFDAATLTGAILIALGNTHTGIFTRSDEVMQRIQKASDVTGELVWRMPLTDFHTEDIKGTHADLCNISGGRNAGSSTAAAFLEEFVAPGIPWAHFDIAGTAWNTSSRFPYNPRKSATGVMVRTFVELAENYR